MLRHQCCWRLSAFRCFHGPPSTLDRAVTYVLPPAEGKLPSLCRPRLLVIARHDGLYTSQIQALSDQFTVGPLRIQASSTGRCPLQSATPNPRYKNLSCWRLWIRTSFFAHGVTRKIHFRFATACFNTFSQFLCQIINQVSATVSRERFNGVMDLWASFVLDGTRCWKFSDITITYVASSLAFNECPRNFVDKIWDVDEQRASCVEKKYWRGSQSVMWTRSWLAGVVITK